MSRSQYYINHYWDSLDRSISNSFFRIRSCILFISCHPYISTMVTSINSEYKIQNEKERFVWICYFFLILMSSLVGDCLVLIASIKRDALKLNKVLVVVIKHIAVCDLIRSVVTVVPTIVSLSSNGWVFGDGLGFVLLVCESSSGQSSNIFVAVLCSFKLLLLKFPMRARNWTRMRAHVVCACVWIFSLGFSTMVLNFHKDSLFDFVLYKVIMELPINWAIPIFTFFPLASIIIPTLVVVLTTIPTLYYLVDARRTSRHIGGRLRWQGILTVVATATVYCICTLPILLVTMSKVLVLELKDMGTYVHLMRAARFLNTLNIT